MPKIPIFETKTKPTAEVGSIKTSFQIPVESAGSIFGSAAKIATGLDEYYVREQALKDKTESTKAYLELNNDLDTIEQGSIKNIDPSQAENTFQNQFKILAKQKIDGMQNKAAARLLEDKLSLDLITRSSKVIQGSRDQLVSEFNNTWNTENQIDLSQYQLAKDEDEKLRLKNKILANASSKNFYNNDGQVKLQEELKKTNANLLFLDSSQLINLENGTELIKNLDDSLKNQTLLTDEDFGKGIFDVYNKKISNLTVKGNPDSDYDRAIEIVKQLETFERSTGYKVNSGELSLKINSLKEKLIIEQIQHEDLLLKVGNNKLFFEYSNDLVRGLTKSITDKGLGLPPEFSDEIAAAEIESEYKQRIKNYLSTNTNVSLTEKKQFARELTYTLKNIYDDKNTIQNSNRILDQNTFNIEEEYQKIINDMKLLEEGNLDSNVLDQYKFRAMQQGFFNIIKDKNGKEIKDGNVKSFINEYLPVLESQIQPTILRK